MINEFDEFATENHRREKEVMSEVSITTIIRAQRMLSDYYDGVMAHTAANYISEDEIEMFETLDNELTDIINELTDIMEKCKTEIKCSYCGETLYMSDLPQYDFVCPVCDENF